MSTRQPYRRPPYVPELCQSDFDALHRDDPSPFPAGDPWPHDGDAFPFALGFLALALCVAYLLG